jgi:hypothetical protein
VHDVRISFRDAGYQRFTAEPGGLKLKATVRDRKATVVVPELRWHVMVVAQR